MSGKKDFVIEQGGTFSQIIRWEAPPIIYKPITAITQSAPVRITSTDHGVPPGWRVAIVSVKGMTQINAPHVVSDQHFYPATVVDSNTIELNEINSTDYKAYVSGGYVQYNTPVSIASYTARMSCKDKVGGTEFLKLTTENNRILINDTTKSIQLLVDDTTTSALTVFKGVYDLELVSPGGVVTPLLSGSITVNKEVTTT